MPLGAKVAIHLPDGQIKVGGLHVLDSYELLKVTPTVKDPIDKRGDIETLLSQVRKDGMTPLTDNALQRTRARYFAREVYRLE